MIGPAAASVKSDAKTTRLVPVPHSRQVASLSSRRWNIDPCPHVSPRCISTATLSSCVCLVKPTTMRGQAPSARHVGQAQSLGRRNRCGGRCASDNDTSGGLVSTTDVVTVGRAAVITLPVPRYDQVRGAGVDRATGQPLPKLNLVAGVGGGLGSHLRRIPNYVVRGKRPAFGRFPVPDGGGSGNRLPRVFFIDGPYASCTFGSTTSGLNTSMCCSASTRARSAWSAGIGSPFSIRATSPSTVWRLTSWLM
jgi:hypothetical protein